MTQRIWTHLARRLRTAGSLTSQVVTSKGSFDPSELQAIETLTSCNYKIRSHTNRAAPSVPSKPKIFQSLRKLERAFLNHNPAILDDILDENITLHGDGLLQPSNITSLPKVKMAMDRFFDRLEIQHVPLDAAVAEDLSIAYAFSIDEVHPGRNVLSSDSKGPDSSGIGVATMHQAVYNEEGQVKDLRIVRQMTPQEKDDKLVDPDISDAHFDVPWLKRELLFLSGTPALDSRVKQVQQIGDSFARMWLTGINIGDADDFVAPDVESFDMLFGQAIKGRSAFKKWVYEPFGRGYEPLQGRHDVAVTTDGNKAFVHWTTHGEDTSRLERDSLEGFHFFRVSKASLIDIHFGWRNPLMQERKELFKDEQERVTLLKDEL